MTTPQCIHIPDGSVAISGQEFDHFCDLERLLETWQGHFRACEAEHEIRTKALQRIDAEVSGCGPEVSKDFLRLALNSVQEMARAALRRSASETGDLKK